ncbi:sensor histidine kinase [Saccharothrix obliqua]|uniref:sensor histidine kinase n=1 Tax=Saccharothrix obliqua TaxID=2861747 RepID=UPI001C5F0258|nr:ATP-binding protein [Saccharothrix obliqua]MBW4720512.1 ATP-binding protein [Saccharothrix obliqua]
MPAHNPSSDPLAGRSAWPAVVAAAIAPAVASGLVWWAALTVPPTARVAVAVSGGLVVAALVAAIAVAGWQRAAAHRHRARADALAAESADLADRLIPGLVRRLRAGSAPDTALAEVDRPTNPDHERVLRTLAEEVGRGERSRAAAMAACGNAAGRMQALATSMLADLREMEDRHGEDVLGDLLKLDHSTAQAGRLADSIAVLTGSRSGRRWTKPIVMESVLRGAIGRISAYQRVRTHSTSTAAIVGYAAEGVMHALAELIDNACGFSPPSEQVHVYVEEVQAGVVVTVEDGGLVMSDLALRRAELIVSGESLDLTGLSGTRLGLAVVGRLARKHGLTISFRPSSRGGTGVVVMIPRTLVTEPRAGGGRRRSAAPPAAPPALPEPTPVAQPEPEALPEEVLLPRRRRGDTLGSMFPPPRRAVEFSGPRTDAGSRFSAFRNAGRPTRDARPEGHPPEQHGPDAHPAEPEPQPEPRPAAEPGETHHRPS